MHRRHRLRVTALSAMAWARREGADRPARAPWGELAARARGVPNRKHYLLVALACLLVCLGELLKFC